MNNQVALDIGTGYPPAAIPLSPILSRDSCSLFKVKTCEESVLALPHVLHVSSGRAAIALALEHAGIGAGHEVLIPAYHCESMISPVKWRKSTAVFYRVNPNTTLDIDDIVKKIGSDTRAVIAAHYFGFLQDLTALRKLCDDKGVLLIEDCAHAFFGSIHGKTVGTWGDYAVASTMKFLPVYDGGVLASPDRELDIADLKSPRLAFQIKSGLNSLEEALEFHRFGIFGRMLNQVLAAKSFVWKYIKKMMKSDTSSVSGPASSEGGYDLDPNWIHMRISIPSRYIINHADLEHIVDMRRKFYSVLDRELSNLKSMRPLYSHLPDNVTPLVYPVYIHDPESTFRKLKEKGVPIWRFGEFLDPSVDETLCQNSVDLSTHVFQFPCHQELKLEELNWMIATIKEVID